MVETLYCREKIEPGHSGRGCSISSWEEGADDPKFKARVGLHSKSEASLGHKKNRVKKMVLKKYLNHNSLHPTVMQTPPQGYGLISLVGLQS